MGLTGQSSTEKIRQELNAESNLYAKNQGIIDGDIKVIGSNLVLGNNSIINGKLTTDSNELHNSYSYEESKKGFSGSIGSGGFSVGYGKTESGLKEKDIINAKSNLVLGDGTTLNKGVNITVGNGKLSIDEYIGHNLENVDKSKTYGRVYSSFKDENGDIVVICQIVLIKKFRIKKIEE